MKKIFLTLIRHGKQAQISQADIICGQKVNFGITKQAVIETRQLTKKLNPLITKVFCSQLIRSSQTADVIIDEYKKQFQKSLLKIVSPEINEVNMGKFEGFNWSKIEKDYPEEAKRFNSGFEKWSFPDGEEYNNLIKRLNKFHHILDQNSNPNDYILIVGHGLINRLFIYHYFPEKKNFGRVIHIHTIK